MTEVNVLAVIQKARQEAWTELDLSGYLLTALPPELAELQKLSTLKLGWNAKTNRPNYLREVPDWLSQLTHLQHLDLSGNRLDDLPESLACLTNLQTIELGYTQLEKLPPWLAHLTQLKTLGLAGNRLDDLPAWLSQLNNLHTLILGGNLLKEVPECISYLTNLQHLDLSHAALQQLPAWLPQLSTLHHLDMSGNQLRSLPAWLSQLPQLHRLNLSGNRLDNLPQWLSTQTSFQYINLSGNPFGELSESDRTELDRFWEPSNWLDHLPALHILDLSHNELRETPEWIPLMSHLQGLSLRSTNLQSLPEWVGQLERLHHLDLSDNNLQELPAWLGQLNELRALDLSGNGLRTLPEWLGQLTNLQSVHLGDNNLREWPPGVAQLSALQWLDLSGNHLCALPEAIGQLRQLQHLDISRNDLHELPQGMAQLTKLQLLDLRSNHLTALPPWMTHLVNLHTLKVGGVPFSQSSHKLRELPEWLVELSKLQTLDLSWNNLSELPGWMANLTQLQLLDLRWNTLLELPLWMADPNNLPHLYELLIGQNPLTVPPAEVLGEALTNAWSPANLHTIRNYLRQLQESEGNYAYEAKLLIIGEGGAGKTSLAHKLIDPTCDLAPDEASTEGIDVLTWHFDLPEDEYKGDRYTANIWDFGGQEIYFATHQFFLTQRSVYLLVADTRREHTDFYDWLLMQETFGGDSPVLIIKNRNRSQGSAIGIRNLAHLLEKFPNLRQVCEVDLQEVPIDEGWSHLLYHVQEHLLSLPHIGQPNPQTWINVRRSIERDARNVISWVEFMEICREQGVEREDDMHQLADYLHNLGDILHFQSDPVLWETVILNPIWGLDAVYAVLDNRRIADQRGQFHYDDLSTLWDRPIYTGYHLHLLRLMQNFQLCYPLPERPDYFIAPQLLTENAPPYQWDGQDNLQLRYYYPLFMPRGIVSRVIVKLHHRIEEQRLVWRYGVILRDRYARAEILELRDQHQIYIRVSGQHKRDLLMEIVRALDDLHRAFPKLRLKRQVPCTCTACRALQATQQEPTFYALERLQERLAYGRETIECDNPPFYAVPIRRMLSEMPLWDEPNGDGHFGPVNISINQRRVGDITNARGIAIGEENSVSITERGSDKWGPEECGAEGRDT